VLAGLGHLVFRRRKLIVVAWIGLAIFGMYSASQVSKRWLEQFSIPGYPAYEANQRTLKIFGTGEQAPLVAVFTAKGDVTVQELTRAQRVVARRIAESRATVPDFTLTAEIDAGALVDLRRQLRALAGEGEPVPSYNDMVVRACALALRASPRANGAYRDGRFERYGRVNVGIAVAAADGLVVPTVFDADRKALAQVAAESRALAERVRSGAVTPPELAGGTFTVSNLGMYGVTTFAAVINPPQAAILAVGALRAVPVVRDGTVVPGHVLGVTLACDHRILYGAPAAEFLADVRGRLEAPVAIL